jgi:hypothetical protein
MKPAPTPIRGLMCKTCPSQSGVKILMSLNNFSNWLAGNKPVFNCSLEAGWLVGRLLAWLAVLVGTSLVSWSVGCI